MNNNEATKTVESSGGLVAFLQAQNAQLRTDMEYLSAEKDALIKGLREEIQILLRRLYGNRTERLNTDETQLAFADLLAKEKELQRQLDEARATGDSLGTNGNKGDGQPQPVAQPDVEALGNGNGSAKPNVLKQPHGRRNLSESSLPRIEVEITDPAFEGKCARAGYDYSYQLYKNRSEFSVLVKKVAKYKVETPNGTAELSARQPESLFPRGLLHTSAVADIIDAKFGRGEPLYRQEKRYEVSDAPVDRGTMSRYVDEAGNALGATVVNAMWADAVANGSVISTDATGALIQPEPSGTTRQSCRKGNFFTAVVDESTVLFNYVPQHTQAAVQQMFGNFRGFLQADAHHVYNILERPSAGHSKGQIRLVGCWAHCRRYFFEAALCKHVVGVQALLRIAAMYALDQAIMKLPRAQRSAQRAAHVLPLMRQFFEFVRAAQGNVEARTKAAAAVGYALNQEAELLAVLENPAIPLDNTRAERALRKIVVGRKNWMFYGSDGHAEAAAAIFSLIATCRLHRIEVVQYFDEVMRVLPYWPKERMLELSPHHWGVTRAKLDPAELASPISRFTIPA